MDNTAVTANKHAVGVFSSRQQAEQAINELQAAGFSMDKVSIIAKDAEGGEKLGNAEVSDKIGDQSVDTTGAVGDALNAGTWGSVLVGLSSLALPGIGAVIAAGSVGAALVTSMAGVAVSASSTNNLVQTLATLGIPEERARHYSDKLQQGYYMVILDGGDQEIQCGEKILRDRDIEYWGVYEAV